jgi:tetratricopeptide (TPR) repeat protein
VEYRSVIFFIGVQIIIAHSSLGGSMKLRILISMMSLVIIGTTNISSEEMHVIHFDGRSGYIQLPSNIFDQENNATIEAWVKWEEFNKWSRVFDFGREGNAVVVQNEKTSSKINFRIWDRGGKQKGTQANKAVNKNTWHHLAVVCGYQGMKIYVDGRLYDEDDYSGGLSQASGGNNLIGKSNWPKDKMFEGFMAEFRVWNYQRSQQEIQKTMRRALSGAEEGLIGYWPMNVVENGEIQDKSSRSNNAQIIGNAELVAVRAISEMLLPGVLGKVVEEHYKKANDLLKNNQFASAIREFKTLLDLNKEYKDAQELLQKSVGLESERIATGHYEMGISMMISGDFRTAYTSFQDANKNVPHFLDSNSKIQECIEKGKYTVAIYPFGSNSREANTELLYQTYIAELHNLKSPFVEIIDQGTLLQMMGSQGVNLNIVSPLNTINAARNAGINIIVLGDIVTASIGQPDFRRKGKLAYTVYSQEYWDDGKKKTRKVANSQKTYHIVNGKVEVRLDCNFKIVNTQNGQIEKTEVLSFKDNDNVEYATYQGDVDYLWTKTYNTFFPLTQSEKRFSERQDLKDGIELMTDLSKNAGKSIAHKTMNFLDAYSPEPLAAKPAKTNALIRNQENIQPISGNGESSRK